MGYAHSKMTCQRTDCTSDWREGAKVFHYDLIDNDNREARDVEITELKSRLLRGNVYHVRHVPSKKIKASRISNRELGGRGYLDVNIESCPDCQIRIAERLAAHQQAERARKEMEAEIQRARQEENQKAREEMNAMLAAQQQAEAERLQNRLSNIQATHNRIEIRELQRLLTDVQEAPDAVKALLENNALGLIKRIQERLTPLKRAFYFIDQLNTLKISNNEEDLDNLRVLNQQISQINDTVKALLPGGNENKILKDIETKIHQLKKQLQERANKEQVEAERKAREDAEQQEDNLKRQFDSIVEEITMELSNVGETELNNFFEHQVKIAEDALEKLSNETDMDRRWQLALKVGACCHIISKYDKDAQLKSKLKNLAERLQKFNPQKYDKYSIIIFGDADPLSAFNIKYEELKNELEKLILSHENLYANSLIHAEAAWLSLKNDTSYDEDKRQALALEVAVNCKILLGHNTDRCYDKVLELKQNLQNFDGGSYSEYARQIFNNDRNVIFRGAVPEGSYINQSQNQSIEDTTTPQQQFNHASFKPKP